jgi:uncharacterized protein YodC (DUF2158 family)
MDTEPVFLDSDYNAIPRPPGAAAPHSVQSGTAFKPGDKVMLPSGGPGMTVMDIGTHSGLVWCVWIDRDGITFKETFPSASLSLDPR